MHAAGALFVVDHQFAIFHPHTVCGAVANDLFFDVKGTPVAAGMRSAVGRKFAADVSGNRFLVDFNIVFPGSDKGDVGPGDGSHTTVGAAVKLELEFVWKGRSVKLVLVFLGKIVAEGLGVVA